MVIPKIIFIIPFRDRYYQKTHFDIYMKYIMEDYDKNDYEIYYSHQRDSRPFNRGAIKNLGFMSMMQKYPNNFKEITFVFNDIDTLPYLKDQLNYKTTKGNIKHFYGFEYALGGIISITGDDFLKMNGFPNYWGWGLEDNRLNDRAKHYKINIDRSNFFSYYDNKILNFDKTPQKLITKNPMIHSHKNGAFLNSGISSLVNINFKIDNEFINITNFNDKLLLFENEQFRVKDCQVEGSRMNDHNKSRYGGIMKMNIGIGQKI